MAAKLQVSRHHRGKLKIDGVEVTLLLRRMTMDEFIEFERAYFDFSQGEKGVRVDVDTTGLAPEDAFLALQKAEATAHLRMTQAEKDDERARTIARAAEMMRWLKDQITQNASFEAGEVEIEGQPVVNGEDILRVFGARQVLMMQIINSMWAQNRLPEGMLKNLPSPSDFPDGSGERETDQAGPSPERIAGSAGEPGSAGTGAATQEQPPATS
jgi:hypothetical protein